MIMGCLLQGSAKCSWDYSSCRGLIALEYVRGSRSSRKNWHPEGFAVFGKKLPRAVCYPLAVIKASSGRIVFCWDQSRRIVKTEEAREEGTWLPISLVLSETTQTAGVASISAATQAPPRTADREPLPRYVITLGVLFSIAALTVWILTKSEIQAREKLISDTLSPVSPRRQPLVITAYDRAKASVAQTACVNKAVAALRSNNLMECTLEMELALEENRVARVSIESDFYEEDELSQVYKSVLKMWLDGYPLDYGKLLQLRSVLDIPGEKAEYLEQEVRQQSDAYVI